MPPQLRSGVRRGRGPPSERPKTPIHNTGDGEAKKKEPRVRRRSVRARKKEEEEEEVVVVDEKLEELEITRVHCGGVAPAEEAVDGKKMDENGGSAGGSKGVGGEDEGSTAPLPERVKT